MMAQYEAYSDEGNDHDQTDKSTSRVLMVWIDVDSARRATDVSIFNGKLEAFRSWVHSREKNVWSVTI
jgi:hypothetical protein